MDAKRPTPRHIKIKRPKVKDKERILKAPREKQLGTYYIRPYYQDRDSQQIYLIHRSKCREAAKMKRQRHMAQMKEQIKTPEKELNKMEISNLSDAEFKTLLIRMLKELSEDLNSIKKIQSEMKDTLIEIMNNLQGNNRRVDEAENQINDLEHKE